MNILINASNLKLGGGIQVADSIIAQLSAYPMHNFTVVYSDYLQDSIGRLLPATNIRTVNYNIKNTIATIVFGRDRFLDRLVEEQNIDCVLTIFGPSRWNPKCRHVSGFAMAHLVLPESPYFKMLHGIDKIKSISRLMLIERAFKNSTKYFYTENPFISELLQKKWPGKCIRTISNYYNQIFDSPGKWIKYGLPSFEGITLLTIAANYPHKNLGIAIDIAHILKVRYPDFKFRFVMTVDKSQIIIPDNLSGNFELIGKIDIAQCPSLYSQADISFIPSLLECFSATYPEAMKMGIPIVTTDLEFAHGLCGDSALYYSSLDANQAAERIYSLASDPLLRNKLISNGKEKLLSFDNTERRMSKLIGYCEDIVKNH